jgi:hypothetical protein
MKSPKKLTAKQLHEQRSRIARKSAAKAWATMRTKKWQREHKAA